MLLAKQSAAVRPARQSTVAAPRMLAPLRVRVAQKSVVMKASSESESTFDSEKVMKDLQAKWDALDNKPTAVAYAGGAIVAVWLSATLVGAINHVPVLPKLMELIGLGYSAWFTYRYLLFKSSREELIKDVDDLKKKITGDA